jgi:sulfonate transport system permease protein
MPLAFVSQTIPLVALAPLIALILGRGVTTIVVVTISVTFFPSLVTMIQGIANAPSGPLDVMRSVNASRGKMMRSVILPNALPHLLASVRLAVPRSLTGVLIAEQYITGTGLGGLLGVSRGYLDYRMMWVIAAAVAVVSFALYAIAQAGESAILRRRA